MTKKQAIARKSGVSYSMISYLSNGSRYTEDRNLAMAIGDLMGMKPINYIHPRLRKVYLKAYPELGKMSK